MATKKKSASKRVSGKTAKKAATKRAATKRPAVKRPAAKRPAKTASWKKRLQEAIITLESVKARLQAAGSAADALAIEQAISLIDEALKLPPGNVPSGNKTSTGKDN